LPTITRFARGFVLRISTTTCLLYKPHSQCKTHVACKAHFTPQDLYKMHVFGLLLFLASSTLALQPIANSTPSPEPPSPGAKPVCFPPFDRHHVSEVVGLCSSLVEDFVHSFGEKMNTSLRWSGNNTERHHARTVHLPQVIRNFNHDRTQECLLELLDHGNGDTYEPSALMDKGTEILNECFAKEDCGEIQLPPHYTTALAVCGTNHQNQTGPKRLWTRPVLEMPFVEYLWERTES